MENYFQFNGILYHYVCSFYSVKNIPTLYSIWSSQIESVLYSASTIFWIFFFFFWPLPWHVETPRARDQTCATAATQAAAVTTLDP